jgi:C-terminal processing protease CtpA/Prc
MDVAWVANRLASEIDDRYVLHDTARQIAETLRARAGQIPPDIAPAELAALLTQWAFEASNDRHLEVRYSPAQPDQVSVGTRDDEFALERRRTARRANCGLARIERLLGNVGLIELTSFFEPALSGDVIVAAMRIVAGMHALIVDLRGNRGGHPGTVALMLTYFFDDNGERVHLNDLHHREGDQTEQHWTLPYVPGPRFGPDKPLYVLISNETFSAAEEFAYDLQCRDRATLIGETTAGGAHGGDRIRLDEQYTAFIPSGRAINPITGTNWESTGLTPDVPVHRHDALQVAHHLALRTLLESNALDDELRAEATQALHP